MSHLPDITIAKLLLADLPTEWDGKQSILELKNANFNWRQMEWWGFLLRISVPSKVISTFFIPRRSIWEVKDCLL